MQHTCSLCGTDYEFVWEKGTPLPKNFPFCSEQCKALDLGKWLNEEYVISTPLSVPITSETEYEILSQLGMNLDNGTEGTE